MKGEKNPNYGKTASEETRKKLSDISIGRVYSEEAIKKMSDNRRGEKNPNYGKTDSEETRKKMSEAAQRRRTNYKISQEKTEEQ